MLKVTLVLVVSAAITCAASGASIPVELPHVNNIPMPERNWKTVLMEFRDNVRETAGTTGVIDRYNVDWFFRPNPGDPGWVKAWCSDYFLLIEHYKASKDLPDVLDRYRFPPEEFVRRAVKENSDHIEHLLNTCLSDWHRQKIYEQLELAARCEKVYYVLVQIQSASTALYQREKLAELKDILGDEFYYSGTLPSSVIPWYERSGK